MCPGVPVERKTTDLECSNKGRADEFVCTLADVVLSDLIIKEQLLIATSSNKED